MMELSDGAILIRMLRPEDIAAEYEAVCESIADVSPWMDWCHEGYRIEETTAFIMSREAAWKNDTDYGFGIFEAGTGKFLGGVGLSFINRAHRYCNLGYWVRSSCTGRGIASRAARLAARFGIEQLGFERIEIVVVVGNIRSQRAAEKAGAVREGILRKRLMLKGSPHDAVLYSLVAEDL